MLSTKINRLLLLVLSAGLFFYSCQREIKWPEQPALPNETAVNDAERVTGGVNGIVINENNQPMAGVTVRSGTNTTTTDRYGVFQFRNIQLSKANGTVSVEKNGYFTGYRSFVAVEGLINNVRIKMLPKSNSGSFDAAAGGMVSLGSGAKLQMPANSVTDAAGTAYTGNVNVAMTWIDPSSVDLPFNMMGDLRGVLTNGAERGLSTFGMIGVEMTGGTGQALKVAPGKTAELSFPIPASLQAAAPDSIDLWHFDEATARWKQEGKAGKTGAMYVAKVSHFSFWNCDAPFPLIDLCMSFKDDHGAPLNNVQVRIKRIVNGSYGYGRTDSTGSLCGKVPKNENLELQLLDICGNPFYTQAIGPFTTNSTLPVITVTLPAATSLTISGTLTTCASTNVVNGAAAIYIEGGHQYTVAVTNGVFSVTIPRCTNTAINYTVLGVDYATLQQSIPVSGTGTTGTVNVGTLQACGTSSLEYIEVMIDGTPFTLATPADYINYNDSTGAAPYLFNTWISGARQNSGTTSGGIQFSFRHNQSVATGLPLDFVYVSAGPGMTNSQSFAAGAASVNTTVFGAAPGGFVEGNFTVQMNLGGTPRTVVCNFRVRR
ncbi:MAG TPA: carboxypeptidase-like regulatory domain-containing protein [Chitinophagaceae bacterium]|nr:carboxypeptidase-like regulatory domain-containing protein [Chitinophagaceae bacterium]HPH30504.1 carboxypeptidase-like regulatory domain-containing protein [Chitinophagaceae bacterium]